jgi:large subunit ribosomal protein L24
MPQRVRKGDLVVVTSGDDRGKRGRVLRVIPEKGRVVIEGVNFVFKHLRKSPKHPNGGRIRKEAPMDMSNVMPVDPESNGATRVAYRLVDGRRVRVGRRSGAALGGAGSKE